MNVKRLKRIALPVLLGLAGVLLILGISLAASQGIYRQAHYREMSQLVGQIAADYPELDTAKIIQTLQGQENNSSSGSSASDARETEKIGAEILQEYGLTEKYFASQNTARLMAQVGGATGLILVLLALALGGYFWWRDWRLEQKVADLVTYTRDLSERVYDLRLEENSEDELSLLANELYKITVLLREAAENQQKLAENLETALADISHQLKTPLTSLQIMLDEIYDDPKMPDKVRQDFLRLMRQQVQSMSNLATTLLNLARLDNGTLKMYDQNFRVQELFDEVRLKLEVLADLYDVELEFTGDLAAEIRRDLHWQAEALTNIVKNAIEHSATGQKVTILAENCPLFLKISVQDAGPGMSAHDLKHIFERFYQVPNARPDTAPASVGIGLAFAKAIVEADNGQITADAEPGKGAKFTLRYLRSA